MSCSPRSTPTQPRPLSAEVTHVSADRLADEQSGEAFYQATIAVPDKEIARLGDDQQLHVGMPADVIIVAGERTMFDYLFEQIKIISQGAWQE